MSSKKSHSSQSSVESISNHVQIPRNESRGSDKVFGHESSSDENRSQNSRKLSDSPKSFKPKPTTLLMRKGSPGSDDSNKVGNFKSTTTKIFDETKIQKVNTHQTNVDKKKDTTYQGHDRKSTSSKPKASTSKIHNLVDASYTKYEVAKPIYSVSHGGRKSQLSIFEKVNAHTGATTYLGTGTFSQLEHCISDCLERNKCHEDSIIRVNKYDCPKKCVSYTSFIDDCCYDGILLPNNQIVRSCSCCCRPQDCCERKNKLADLCLNDLREINDNLAKHGIHVFTNQPNPSGPQSKAHSIGEILAACRLLSEDPTLAQYKSSNQVVQQAWDYMRNQPAAPNTGNYGHNQQVIQNAWNFMRNQPPYPYQPSNNGPSAIGSAGSPYSNSSQPSQNPAQGVLSRLFSGAQQPQYGASPFNNALQAYPGNNNYMY